MLTLLVEKGTDPWHRDREPVLKKLKVTETKLSGPRSAIRSPQARTGTTADSASPSESSDSDSDDDSEYYSESDVGTELEEPSPLPTTRPADPSKAVEYDVIKAVWAKKSTSLSGAVIRTALTEYWDIFKGIRDKWKIKSNSLQQAIEKKDQTNSKTFERRVLEQRRLLESCIRLTLKHGHPDIIEKYVLFLSFLSSDSLSAPTIYPYSSSLPNLRRWYKLSLERPIICSKLNRQKLSRIVHNSIGVRIDAGQLGGPPYFPLYIASLIVGRTAARYEYQAHTTFGYNKCSSRVRIIIGHKIFCSYIGTTKGSKPYGRIFGKRT